MHHVFNMNFNKKCEILNLRVLILLWIYICGGHLLNAQNFLNPDAEVTIMPVAINTKHLEYAPMYYGSGMIFVHAREQAQLIDRKLGMPFFELMYSEFTPDGLPGRAVSFSPNIRTRFHEGPATFNRNETQIFFTRSNYRQGQNITGADGRTNLKIYVADKGPEDWVNIREMPFCSDDYSVQAPTLSPDETEIIFMSNMPGGYGGWDLYISSRATGVWSEPQNLGPAINTPKHERFPFWHQNGVLFFASDGHPGMGGLDIFASIRGEDGQWSAPVNLGAPFNSRRDDLTFICDPEGKTGFFASARKESLGKDDIFYFRSDESIFGADLLPREKLIAMTLAVRNKTTLEPVAGASLWAFPIGATGAEGISEYFDTHVMQSDDGDASVVIRLRLRTDIEDIGPHFISDVGGHAQIHLPGARDHLVVVVAEGYGDREYLLRHGMIRSGVTQYIDLSSLDEPASDIGHRDCITGGALVITAADAEPIEGVLILIENTCNGTQQVLLTDTTGHFRTCLTPGCRYVVSADKEGYIAGRYDYRPGEDPDDRTLILTEADLEARTGRPKAGDVLVLEHIYYDFDKSAIRTGDARELESLAAMMRKYPSMTIELRSHTDSRGSAEYNLELSERRAVSAMEFLVARGVDARRINLKPMGETELRNHCREGVPCTDEEHQQNRRTEIRVLTMDPELEVRYPEE